jgi:hypothetical protein
VAVAGVAVAGDRPPRASAPGDVVASMGAVIVCDGFSWCTISHTASTTNSWLFSPSASLQLQAASSSNTTSRETWTRRARRVVYPVCFVPWFIPEQHHLLAPVIKLAQVWLHRLHMHHAPKRAQVMHCELDTMPCLIRCTPGEALRRRVVEEIYGRHDGLAPELRRHTSSLQQALCHRHNRLVLALHDTVLLRRVWRHQVPAHATPCAPLAKLN